MLPASEGGSWWPDGKRFAVPAHGSYANEEPFLVAADGSGSTKVARIKTEAFVTSETFSPDGKTVLLGGSSDVPYALTVVPVDGSAAPAPRRFGARRRSPPNPVREGVDRTSMAG